MNTEKLTQQTAEAIMLKMHPEFTKNVTFAVQSVGIGKYTNQDMLIITGEHVTLHKEGRKHVIAHGYHV